MKFHTCVLFCPLLLFSHLFSGSESTTFVNKARSWAKSAVIFVLSHVTAFFRLTQCFKRWNMSRISLLIKVLWELDWKNKSAWIHSPSQLHTDSQERPFPQSFRNFLEGLISYLTHRSVFQLGLMAKVKGYLSPADSEKVTRAFITCAWLLQFLACQYWPLAAPSPTAGTKFICPSPHWYTGTHISPVLAPCSFWDYFKSFMMVFKALHGVEASVFTQPFTLLCSQNMV